MTETLLRDEENREARGRKGWIHQVEKMENEF